MGKVELNLDSAYSNVLNKQHCRGFAVDSLLTSISDRISNCDCVILAQNARALLTFHNELACVRSDQFALVVVGCMKLYVLTIALLY